jgi:hypothetical protein
MFIDMASKVKFHIYYIEEGRVEYIPKGIILQRFRILTSMIDNPEDWTFWFVYQWLAHGFQINLDTTLLMVHVVVK